VIVTDVLQATIIFGCLSAIVCKGIVDVGGFNAMWDIASEFDRTEFLRYLQSEKGPYYQ
jgi:Na+/proline symporter